MIKNTRFEILAIDNNLAIMLCLLCNDTFDIEPISENNTNLAYYAKKDVYVPQCPHCGNNDLRKKNK